MKQFDLPENIELQKSIKEWVSCEIWCFYLFIIAAAVFLLYIQIRGSAGYHEKYRNLKKNKGRSKKDPLTFYN